MENLDLQEAVHTLVWEWHRDRYGPIGHMAIKKVEKTKDDEIKIIYEVKDQLFMIDIKRGLPGQSTI